jgi:hypothetical protein
MVSVRGNMGKPYRGFEQDHAKPIAFAIWLAAALGPAGLFITGAEFDLWSDLHEWPSWLNAVLAIWTMWALAAHRPAIDRISRLIDRTRRLDC